MSNIVSVVIPCFNQGRFLRTAIESALGQTHRQVEVIVVNDGSTDDTARVAAAYAGRIKYVEQSNQGLSAARNTGIRGATGEFLHFLDADDFIQPEMYERMLWVLAERPDAVAAYCGYHHVDMDGHSLDIVPARPESDDVFHLLLCYNPWPCHSLVVRRSSVDSAGFFDPRLPSCEDWDLWLRIAAQGSRFAPVDGEFACYRWYAQSMSKKHATMFLTALHVIRQNARRHGFCPQCRRAAAAGIRHVWNRYVLSDMNRDLEAGRFGQWLRRCGEVGMHYLPSLWWSGKSLRHLRRAIPFILSSKRKCQMK
jgi:glycosyltransferase involved in cell wall biosynthesis